MRYVTGYIYNWLVLCSKAFNTLLGGSPHESFSMWLARRNIEHGEYEILVWLVNSLFFWETDHILDAYDEEDHAVDLREL